MTGNDLLEKMSLMDVSYVEKANEETKKTAKGWHRWRRIVCAAACLVVVAVAGACLSGGFLFTGDNGSDVVLDTVDGSADVITDDSAEESADVITDDSAEESADVVIDDSADEYADDSGDDSIDASSDGSYEETVEDVPENWGDMEIYQRYSVIAANDISYTAKSTEISADQVGEELATVTAVASYDESELSEEERTCEVQVYAIKNLSTACAVAVQYTGSEICYAAVNTNYQPTTLGQLTEDMNLESTLEIGSVWYYEEGQGFSVELDQFRVDGAETDGAETGESETVEAKIWKILHLDAELTESTNYEKPECGVQISAKIPLIGYEISVGSGYGYVIMDVCEDGYLIISIPDTGDWMFDIGEDAAEEFISYVRSLEES